MSAPHPIPDDVEREALLAELARLRAENDALKWTLVEVQARINSALSPAVVTERAVPS